MAKFCRRGDLFIIRTSLPINVIETYKIESPQSFGEWCHLHQVRISHAKATTGSELTFDVEMLDEHIAFIFRKICEIERRAGVGGGK